MTEPKHSIQRLLHLILILQVLLYISVGRPDVQSQSLRVLPQPKSWLLFVFFCVIPRRLIYICRRFGTLYLFHLQRQVPAFDDGTDRVFRKVGIYKSGAGESHKRKQTT